MTEDEIEDVDESLYDDDDDNYAIDGDLFDEAEREVRAEYDRYYKKHPKERDYDGEAMHEAVFERYLNKLESKLKNEQKKIEQTTPEADHVIYLKKLAKGLDKRHENKWITERESYNGCEFNLHTFGKQKSIFILNEFASKDNGCISFYPNIKDKFHVDYLIPIHRNIGKHFVDKTIEHFDKEKNVNMLQVKEYLDSQYNLYKRKPEQEFEVAQKTGYVQGVCESVLAFNTDENRKIMSESTMTFLSKKLLSEMNVTKDMAQKFANPETYKALEQCVFVPKQEQHLEQTQSQGRSM